MHAPEAWQELLQLLVMHSYRRADTDIYLLSSGRRSNYYIDCKVTTMRGEAMPLIGAVFAPHIPTSTDAVGGLTLGADALAGAIAYYCQMHGQPLNSFTVRKAPKQHGTAKYIEGCPGNATVVLDDVVTTGASTITAIQRCREAGITVLGVVALVDREESGLAAIRAEAGEGVPVHAIFTRSDLERCWQAKQDITG